MKKLAEFADTLDTVKNPSNNILNDLCTGLETFLGFNSDSKGYDGKGIVYSDLDRLCDAVMGFLSGVLSAVKDDEAVKTYDEYMNESDRLNKVLETLSKNIGTGRHGLVESVEQVKRWLENYLFQLNDKTSDVTLKLGELINETINTYANNVVSDHQGKKLEDQLAAWTSVLGSISDAVRTVETNVNMLDGKLKIDVMREVTVINKSVQVLKDSAKKEEFVAKVKEVDNELKRQKEELAKLIIAQCQHVHNTLDTEFGTMGNKINGGFTHLKIKLEDEFSNIGKEIKNVRDNKGTQFQHLKYVVRESLKRMNDLLVGFDGEYTTVIAAKMYNIESQLKKIDPNDMQNGGNTVDCRLHRDVDELNRNIRQMEQEILSGSRSIGKAIHTSVQNVIASLKALDGKVISDLGNLKGRINQALERYVKTQIEAIVTAAASSTGDWNENTGQKGVKALKDGELKGELGEWMEGIDRESDVAKGLEGCLNLIRVYGTAVSTQPLDETGKVSSALKNDLGKQVDEVIGAIKANDVSFKKIFASTDAEMSGEAGNSGTLHAKIADITRNLVSYFQSQIKGIDDQFDLTSKTAFGEYNAKRAAKDSSIQNILETIEELQKVPTDVIAKKSEIDQLMRKLKDENINLQKDMKIVEASVNNADEVCEETMRCLQQAFHNAYDKTKEAISHFHKDLQDDVKESYESTHNVVEQLQKVMISRLEYAFKCVTDELRNLCATERKADLESLKKSIYDQSIETQRLIAVDQKSNVKGLLHLFKIKLPLLHHTYFPSLVSRFRHFYDQTHSYVKYQLDGVDDADPDSQSVTPDPLAALLLGLTGKVDKLLSELEASEHFNYEFRQNLDALERSLKLFTPSKFGGPCTVLLDVVKGGVEGLAGELDKAYVSTYDSRVFKSDLIKNLKHKVGNKGVEETYDSTEEGTNCAKLFFTMISIISDAVSEMRSKCVMTWKDLKLNLNGKNSPLGLCFKNAGFAVSKADTVHDGELRNRMSGQKVNEKLKAMNGTDYVKHVSKWKADKYQNSGENVTLLDILDFLHDQLETYYQVRHYATFFSKKRPCSVYEMLCWLSGFPCNNAYEQLLGDGLSDPFKDPRKQTKEVDDDSEFTVEKPESLYLQSSPQRVTYNDSATVVQHLSPMSHDILTTLLGYGDADTTYAVDFSSNAMNLHYPQKGEDCLQMLLDILCRLLPQLRYLHEKCKLGTEHGGWYSCKYGKGIKTSKWPCTEHSSDEPNDKATCQPKSPLQSYLNDCLPGHLPHRVESIGCNAVCKTCPKSTPGMPCLTPLGFRGFSGSTKKGKDICSVLSEFLNEVDISCLFALAVKPPRTLPEHIGFTLSLVNGWHVSREKGLKNALQDAFENDIGKQSIGLVNKRGSLTDALRDAYGRSQENHITHEDNSADLSSLSMSTACTGKLCAPYISTSCVDIYNYLPYKHANLYLSWAIYLPWTFWDLLNNLYNAFCSINCQDWGCRGCLRGDKCKKGEHGVVDDEKKSAICQCRSIVDCKGVAPTLYQYGFVFGEASTLNDKTSPKKCSDFCSQLKNVLKSKYFEKLFEECDNFLWKIRFPFMTLTLALWLLSFLYLLHIMVIRLDLLHIKSHLHSPSSHRIAAQSLLAAARVSKLNRVFYLQP